MKRILSKKIFSMFLCCCFIFLAGCSSEPADGMDQVSSNPSSSGSTSGSSSSATSEKSSSSSTATTTTTTTTTTTKQSSSTEPTTPTKPSSSSSTKPSQKPDDSPDKIKLVALTFDDGPHNQVTKRIVNALEKNGAKATFFVVGNRANYDPATLKKAVSIGCEIGSHTHTHKNLTKLTSAQIADEMNKSANAISAAAGVTVKLMRPPEGAHNETVRKNLNYPLIMWSVDSMDWKYRDAQKDYDSVMNSVFDGAIILMHDLYPATAEAVERLIPDLMAKGYRFVTVSELMESRGVTMQSGKTYSAARPK